MSRMARSASRRTGREAVVGRAHDLGALGVLAAASPWVIDRFAQCDNMERAESTAGLCGCLVKAIGWADAGAPFALVAPGPLWRPRRASKGDVVPPAA